MQGRGERAAARHCAHPGRGRRGQRRPRAESSPPLPHNKRARVGGGRGRQQYPTLRRPASRPLGRASPGSPSGGGAAGVLARPREGVMAPPPAPLEPPASASPPPPAPGWETFASCFGPEQGMRARGATPRALGRPRPPATAGLAGRRGVGGPSALRGAAVCAGALRFPPPRLRRSGGAEPGGRRACPLLPCAVSRRRGGGGGRRRGGVRGRMLWRALPVEVGTPLPPALRGV